MIISFIHWNPSPEIFSLSFLTIRWYGLLFTLGFITGYYIIGWMMKREKIDIKLLDSLTTYMVISTVIGARLGHVLFYQPMDYLAHPLDILKVWEGGLASHGAAIGILTGLFLYSRKYKQPFLSTVDRIVVVTALAGCFIRLGNLMNSEIYGHETHLPWAFIFERDDMIPRHPTQIYEALGYLSIFFILLFKYKSGEILKPGRLLGWFLILVFGLRFFVEFLKEPQVGFEQNMLLNMGQLLSIPFILIGTWFLLRKPTQLFSSK